MTQTYHARLSTFIQTRFRLQTGEGARLGLMMLYAAAVFGGVDTVGFIVSSALFLSRLPGSAVPYAFILPAVGIVLALLLYAQVSTRVGLERAVVVSTLLMAALAFSLRLLLFTPYGDSFVVLAALYLLTEIAFAVVAMQFWIIAGRVFDLREARRLFGVMMVGGTLASVTAGLLLAETVEFIGAENLLFLVVLALLTCTFCAVTVGRLKVGDAANEGEGQGQLSSWRHDLRLILHSPLLRTIAGLTVLLALLTNIGTYGFYLALQAGYAGNEEGMVVFLGRFEFFAGLAALIVQVYLTGRVLRRFGAFAALLFFPLALALGASLGLLTGGALLAMTIILASNVVFRDTINDTALNILYLPVPAELRERAKEVFETLFALTVGVAGVTFLVMQGMPGWHYAYWSVPLLLLIVAFLALLVRARAYYRQALRENVSRRQLDLTSLTLDLTDEETSRVLAEALRHPDALMVLHALKLIGEAPSGDWRNEVLPLLAHPSREVKLGALRYLERCQKEVPREPVKALFTSADEEVGAAALVTYAALEGNSSDITPYLQSPAPYLKGAAVLALARHRDAGSRQVALTELEAMLESPEPAMRAQAAYLIGALKLEAYDARLHSLLEDGHLEVERSAIRAAGVLRRPVLLPRLLEMLTVKATASDATEAIVQFGERALPSLRALLAQPEGEVQVRARVPAILRRVNSLAAAHVLLEHLGEPDKRVRSAVLKALIRLQGSTKFIPPGEALEKALLEELASAYRLHVIQHSLADTSPLLSDALTTRLETTLERIFLLLELRHPGELGRAYQAWQAGGADERALAIELLDNLLDGGLKTTLLPLLEAPAEDILSLAHSRFGLLPQPHERQLDALATGEDAWLRACAIFDIGALEVTALSDVVLKALQSPDPLLRETALAACRNLLPPERLSAIVKAHATTDLSPIVRVYAKTLLEAS